MATKKTVIIPGAGAVQGYTEQTDGSQAMDVNMVASAASVSTTSQRISTNTAGDNQLLAAVAAKTHRIHSLRLSVAGAVVVQVKDGATVLEVFNFAGNGGGLTLDFREKPYYVGGVNTAFIINLSAAVQVEGRFEYITA